MFVNVKFRTMGKSRKKIVRSLGILLLAITLMACKKEVEPSLLVTVVNNANVGLPGSWVAISLNRVNEGIVNAEILDAAFTDEDGEVRFKFKNTVLVDVAVYKSPTATVIEDSTSVLLETKRKRGKENLNKIKLVIRD